VSRLAAARAEHGGRTWFVEEPCVGDVDAPTLRSEAVEGLTRVWLEVPGDHDCDRMDFDDPRARSYADLLAEHLAAERLGASRDVWIYTPMAIELAQAVGGRLVYDVMDDLASFKDAPVDLVLRQRRLLGMADIVFTGGPSLHRSVRRQRTRDVHLFRSGVDTDHYRRSRRCRARRGPQPRPVAGYVGVIDERLDLDLLADAARLLPGWTLRVVGPVTKVDPASLPRLANIEYPGMTAYEALPDVMAGFDVALMPFALNEATTSISPTKTLEYLAAGLPVVSTRVPDVVADHSAVVHLVDDAAELADACRHALVEDGQTRDATVAPLLARQEWDSIAVAMARLLQPPVADDAATEETA
jgi:glycosyltransferase involved in cell wall biosynthesis